VSRRGEVMDFSLNEEQEMLRRSARDFLESECPKTLVREMAEDEMGYSPQLWHEMAELGWQGLNFPADYGGASGSFLDLIVLLEEMGRALVPSPFFATVVLGGLSILEAGSEEQKKRYLPQVAKGDLLLTLAITETGARCESDPATVRMKATPHQGDFIINGAKLFVPYAHVADYLVCATRTKDKAKVVGGITNFIVNARSLGVTCTPLETIGRDKQCEVIFENTMVPRQDILGKLNGGWADMKNVLQKATVALCAEMNGGTQQILEMSVDYAKKRTQFGHPIGSYQAMQHRCADMLIAFEASRALTYEAAWRISQGLPCTMEVSMAKSWASESYRQATWLGMQIHGGVAYIEGHDMPLYYRRAKAAEVTLGDADAHREIIARELLS
jgi:alkylation response protein AidB-like acyl-CoA dehydrogenase